MEAGTYSVLSGSKEIASPLARAKDASQTTVKTLQRVQNSTRSKDEAYTRLPRTVGCIKCSKRVTHYKSEVSNV